VSEPESPAQPSPVPEREPEPQAPPVEEPPPAEPPREEPPAPQPPKKAGEPAIDLSTMLAQLQTAAPKALTVHKNLDEVFDTRRTQAAREAGVQEAAEQLELARTYLEMGMADEAVAALTNAAKIPAHRFEAASLLGRLFLKKNEAPRAVEWFERAADAPAPTLDEGRALLYDLGSTLEATGEVSRALAVFMELQADAGDYKDVATRVDRLARVQTGG
jgi:lipopolysaccharide biosynthesis regulator YciM